MGEYNYISHGNISRIIRIVYNRSVVHHFWLAKLFLSKCLHGNERGELNDGRNAKSVTTNQSESSRVWYNIPTIIIRDPENKKAGAMLN